MKTPKTSFNLLFSSFVYYGKVAISATHTSQGKASQWAFLAREGYVEKCDRLFHPFNYRITHKGRMYLEEMLVEYRAEQNRQLAAL